MIVGFRQMPNFLNGKEHFLPAQHSRHNRLVQDVDFSCLHQFQKRSFIKFTKHFQQECYSVLLNSLNMFEISFAQYFRTSSIFCKIFYCSLTISLPIFLHVFYTVIWRIEEFVRGFYHSVKSLLLWLIMREVKGCFAKCLNCCWGTALLLCFSFHSQHDNSFQSSVLLVCSELH